MREDASYSMTDPVARPGRQTSSPRPWLDRWMALLRTIGNIQAWVILSVFYVFVILPMGVVFRLLADPLRLRPSPSTWQRLERQYASMDEAGEQS